MQSQKHHNHKIIHLPKAASIEAIVPDAMEDTCGDLGGDVSSFGALAPIFHSARVDFGARISVPQGGREGEEWG